MISRRSEAGVSLLEMVLTLGVLLLISTLLVPRFSNVQRVIQKIRVVGVSTMLSSDIRRIQSLSRLQNGLSDSYRLQMNFSKNSYYLIKNSNIIKVTSLAEDYQGIEFYGRFSEISFSANGAPSQNGTVKIYSAHYPDIFRRVDILPVSGRVGVY